MTILTPEQRQAVERAGEAPVRIEDPQTYQAFVLLRAEVYDRLRGVAEAEADGEGRPTEGPRGDDPYAAIPEGIRRSQEAFFRDLPELLKVRRWRKKWVAYRGDERVKIGRTQTDVIRECNRRGLAREEYDVFVIEPQSPEPEEVDYPSAWYDIGEPELDDPSTREGA